MELMVNEMNSICELIFRGNESISNAVDERKIFT